MKIKHKNYIYGILLPLLILASCKKLIEVDPPIDQITPNALYASNIGAASVLNGLFFDMTDDGFSGGKSGLSLRLGLSADELTLSPAVSDVLSRLYKNSLVRDDNMNWSEFYTYIFKANAAIEGVNNSSGISTNVRNQLLGEAKFIRAFSYFNLINIFGDVPLVLSTDYALNAKLGRTARDLVYVQVLKDLTEAHEQLNADYLGGDAITPNGSRIVPNKAVASALLAKVYLYIGNWSAAETYSSEVIEKSDYTLENLTNVFLKDSHEVIWQLERGATGYDTDGKLFILINGANANDNPVSLSPQLLGRFETGDLRFTNWVGKYATGVYYPYKYKEGIKHDFNYAEYTVVFRLAEQYLIRAEARAQQNKLIGSNSAKSDLDIIRTRAGLAGTTASNQTDILKAILDERQVELFTEWGNRWFDLKRLGKINEVMDPVTTAKGGTWRDEKALFPIPQADIEKDPGLAGQQNPGY